MSQLKAGREGRGLRHQLAVQGPLREKVASIRETCARTKTGEFSFGERAIREKRGEIVGRGSKEVCESEEGSEWE